MNSKFGHCISLTLNVLLAATAVWLALRGATPSPQSAPSAPVASANEPHLTSAPKSSRFMESASRSDQRRWLVDQLRAMGVPNNILARIVQADLDATWTKYAGELTLKCHGDSEAMAALQLQIDMSTDSDMRAALGEEGFRRWDHDNMLREANPGKVELTATEADEAYDVWKKLQQRELDLKKAQVDGTMDPADAADAQAKAQLDFAQQMKTLLGDERYAESQQPDNTTAAASLRQEFSKADPTDSQFQQLLQAQQQWNERRSDLDREFQDDPSSATYTEQIKALDSERDSQYQSVLGTNVFSAIQKDQDPGYSKMKKCETIWGLDDSSIDSIYGTLKYYEKSVSDYQTQVRALEASGQNVDWSAANKNLQQFSQQIQQSLRAYLGSDRFNQLQQNGVFQFTPNQFSYNH